MSTPEKPTFEPGAIAPVQQQRNRRGRWTLWVAGAILVLAAVFTVLPRLLSSSSRTTHVALKDVLANPPAGWTAQVLPLGDSQEMRKAVAGILQYDDAIFVRYSRPTGEPVEIYAAYWGPGRAPYSMVAVHTPDTCWINNGARRLARTHQFQSEALGEKLKPVELGVYAFNDRPIHVMYWHLVGGEPHDDFGLSGWVGGAKGYLQRLPLLFRDMRRYSLDLAQDQVFVRISSTTPIEELLGQSDFQQLLRSLEPLGLFEPKRELK